MPLSAKNRIIAAVFIRILPIVFYISLGDKPEGFDACYAKLKAEADEKFGNKELMTVEEYFGKLRYMVNAYYDDIQGQN